jgi:hypothetical protein
VRALVFLLLVAPSAVAAQSSQFGVRGLGAPGRPFSAHAIGSGAAFGMFDPESSLNPAALASAGALTAVFTGTQDYRHVENPRGTASVRESRFPQIAVVGPIKKFPAAVGISYSNYTSRDFTLGSEDTVELRDVLVPVSDTVSSRGGLSDLRLAGAYHAGAWRVGGAFHILTGSNRLRNRRVFSDTSYLPITQRSEISYAGVGASLGMIRQFGGRFAVAAIVRSDGHVNVDRDSARVATVDLPYTFGVGLRWRARPRLEMAGQLVVRTWSGANSDLLDQGGVGAENTIDAAWGGEYTTDVRSPYKRPIRFGVRYATLPFPLVPGERPREFGLALGSGTRFAQQRAGVDLSLEHFWRSAGDFKERAFVVSVGISVRP